MDCRTNGSGGSGEVETYSYDLADRLTLGTVTSACSGGTTTSTESYGLNNADFILSKSGEATASNNWTATNTGPVNDIGTLTPSGGSPWNYTYDANGNVTSDGVRSYSWDAENRLLSITEGSQVSSFTYDGLGRRVAITESSGTTGYLWCGSTLCSSYASGTTQDRFLPWGEVDSGTEYYYERDHLGTVVSTTNTSGTTEATLGTDGYGWTLSSSLTSGASAPNFGYAGMFSHAPSGLYLTANRAYDPYSGRWLSRDPANEAGGINLYAYVGDGPVNAVDPLGLVGVGGNFGGGSSCGGGGGGGFSGLPLVAQILITEAIGLGPEDIAADVAVSGEILAAEGGLTTAEQLTAAAGNAVATVGPGSGSVYGTLVHSAFSDEVVNLGNSNLSSEVSYLNGEVVPYGTSGSVRLDVVEGPPDAPIAIYDLKTGSATLTPSRVLQIQNNIPGGTGVPVSQITPP